MVELWPTLVVCLEVVLHTFLPWRHMLCILKIVGGVLESSSNSSISGSAGVLESP